MVISIIFLPTKSARSLKKSKHVEISSSDETKLIGDIVFEEIFKRAKQKHRYTPFKRDYSFNRICDSQNVRD